MGAANAERFVDDGNDRLVLRRLRKRDDVSAQQVREPADRCVATGRAQVDRLLLFDDRLGIRPAAGVAAQGALRLRQQFIDLLDE